MIPPPQPAPRRRRWPAVALTAALVATAACGSDTPDGTGDDDDGSAVIVTTTVGDTTAAGTTDPDTTEAATPESTDPATTEPGTTDAETTEPSPSSAPSATAPATMGNPSVEFVEVGRFDQPVDVGRRPGDPRLFVVEQPGRVVAVGVDGSDPVVVLDVTDLTDAAGERGLLGLAFDPDEPEAYVHLTDAASDTLVAAFRVGEDGTFDRDSLRPVLRADQPYGNHNGGDLEFGPDGKLYIGLGDGGSANDPERRSLRLDTPLGKLLRIDPTPDLDPPYAIPSDNPYLGVPDALPELFAIGLRNPWRFTFDPATDDLWIADVGQNRLEEVNHVADPGDGSVAGAGLSFGWSAFEGTDRFNGDQPEEGHTSPVLVYEHGADGCSISGGVVYRGEAIPELRGGYVYSDYCSGKVWALDLASSRNLLLGTLGQGVTSVASGIDGELLVTMAGGAVLRVTPAG
jgi:glucose/arabinose dehydrogenase